MNTISELNTKIWYRFIKVVFIIVFIFVSLISITIIYDSYRQREVDDYFVTCNYGNKKTFYAWTESNIFLTEYDLRNYLSSIPDDIKERIQKICAISQEELNSKFDAISRGTDDGKKLFDITKSKVSVGSTLKVISMSLVDIIIVIIILETLKRIFYYIVLGSFRPQK